MAKKSLKLRLSMRVGKISKFSGGDPYGSVAVLRKFTTNAAFLSQD